MILEVEDYYETYYLDRAIDVGGDRLRECLLKRHGDRNSFWLRFKGKEFPSLNLGFIRELATANYFAERIKTPSDWVSKSNVLGLRIGGETSFYYNSQSERQDMDNAVVITAQSAISAAVEFYSDPSSRPTSIEWFEL